MTLKYTVCSDLHNAPLGHPANDSTPGWREAWRKIPPPKLRLGDMDELWQFSIDEIQPVYTDVNGNHDSRWSSLYGDIVKHGNTIFLHGHQFDPWLVKLFGRPIAWIIGKLEKRWPDVDNLLTQWARHYIGGGRYGERERYIQLASDYARKNKATQIVFGHLHELFEEERDGVNVICTGCCVGGRMDFVEVIVEERE